MLRLNNSEIANVHPLFDNDHLRLVVDGIISGITTGQIWADDAAAPSVALMWESWSIYIAGNPESPKTIDKLRQLYMTEIAPQALAQDNKEFKLVYTPETWSSKAASIFGPLTEQNLPRRTYCSIDNLPTSDTSPLAEGFKLRQIDAALLNSDLTHLDELKAEILGGWPSLEVFLARGFGFAMLTQTAVICWCTAEYLSNKKCGIGIETVEGYGQKGIATRVASAFVQHALAREIKPYWDCWENNIASVRVAEKVGFANPHYYSVARGDFAQSRPQDIEFLYYFTCDKFAIMEAKIIGLDEATSPDQVYHWLCYDRSKGQFEKLTFKAMGNKNALNYRKFSQAELFFDGQQARLRRPTGGAQDLVLDVYAPHSLPIQLALEVRHFLSPIA